MIALKHLPTPTHPPTHSLFRQQKLSTEIVDKSQYERLITLILLTSNPEKTIGQNLTTFI